MGSDPRLCECLRSTNHLVEAALVVEEKFRKSMSLVLTPGKAFVDSTDIYWDSARF